MERLTAYIPDFLLNTMVLIIILILVMGAGIWMTYVRQPTKLERIKGKAKVERMKHAKVTTLLKEEAATRAEAERAVTKWKARYKVIPDTVSSPAVVGFLNDLTRSGFENFDISFQGVRQEEDYSSLNYSIQGRGYFSRLYDVVWEVENNRNLYRINNLNLNHIDFISEDKESGKKRMEVMVSFDMELKAYFGASEGMSAPEARLAQLTDKEMKDGKAPPEVPDEVLPNKKPAVNFFFPNIMDKLPPNTQNLVDVEKAKLISIADGKAVFQDGEGFRAVGEGDDVYLGQIVQVNPQRNRVVAQLNKGGILDRVTLTLGSSGEDYRQAEGDAQLQPLNGGGNSNGR
jgi:hypothetical protein